LTVSVSRGVWAEQRTQPITDGTQIFMIVMIKYVQTHTSDAWDFEIADFGTSPIMHVEFYTRIENKRNLKIPQSQNQQFLLL